MKKMYQLDLNNKLQTSGEKLLCDYLELMYDYGEEVKCCDATIGEFTLHYMGADDGKTHALIVMDDEENVVEYFVFENPETLRHWEMEKPANEHVERVEAIQHQFEKDTDEFLENYFQRGSIATKVPPVVISYNGLSVEIPLESADVHEAFSASLDLFKNALADMI